MSAPAQNPGQELDFEIVEEHWNEYEAENGRVSIRARAILTRLFQQGQNQLGASAQFIVTSRALRADLKGSPSTAPFNPSDPRYAVQFNPISEPWNIYRTRGAGPSKTIRTRLVVSNIERVADKFDNLGEPSYAVAHQLVVAPPMDSANPASA